LGDGNTWRVADLVDDGLTRFTVREDGRTGCEGKLQVPGPINARNALGVLLIATRVGIAWPAAARALRDFRGVSRRQEVVAEAHGVTVIGDFAHPPNAVGR